MIRKGGMVLGFGLLPTLSEAQIPRDADCTHMVWFGESLSGITREVLRCALQDDVGAVRRVSAESSRTVRPGLRVMIDRKMP